MISTARSISRIKARTGLARCCLSSSSSSSPPSLDGPSKPSQSWERSARSVKNIEVKNEYLQKIRQVHDPAQHIKTLEDELRSTMGKALGKQGDKILRALRNMQVELDRYHDLLETHSRSAPAVLERARQYNFYREQAKTARWELIVHRQAIGFIVNNHNFVSDKYPIRPALPETPEQVHQLEEQQGNGDVVIMMEESNTKWRGQLDWWQRVGRWR